MQSFEAGTNLASRRRKKGLKYEKQRGRGRLGPGSHKKSGHMRNLALFQWHLWETRSTGTLLLTSVRTAPRIGKASGDMLQSS